MVEETKIKKEEKKLTPGEKIQEDVKNVNNQIEQVRAQLNYLIGYKESLKKSLEYLKND